MSRKRNILLIVPSIIIARGLESIFNDMGEFQVAGVLTDIGHQNVPRLKNIDAEAVILDPSVLDYESRPHGKAIVGEYLPVPVVALLREASDEETTRQYDAVIGLFESPGSIVKKLRAALEASEDSPRSEGDELSAREKEILICVAKGMINKEIADLYNISIHTVITHRKNISRKTGIKTVAGLTVYALLNNLIDMKTIE